MDVDDDDGASGAGGGAACAVGGGGGGPGIAARAAARAAGGRRLAALARASRGQPAVRYGPEVEDEILRRVAAGETLHRVCTEPGMPSYTAATGWLRKRPGFRARMEEARRAAGRPWRAPASPFCDATFDAIFERLCLGEGLVAICRDAGMPDVRTVYRWLQARADLREAVELARQIQGDRIGELGFDEAMAATPQTARLVEVRLRHLRWWAAKLAPVAYGAHRATDPPEPVVVEPPPQPRVVMARAFWIEHRDDGWRRVRGSHPDPETGAVVDEPAGPWKPPPEGSERWVAERAAARAEQAGRVGMGRKDDPEGWL